MSSLNGAGAPVSFRISDLHNPDILPILGVPIVPPPHRSSYEGESAMIVSDVPDAATLNAVINMLEIADVSQL